MMMGDGIDGVVQKPFQGIEFFINCHEGLDGVVFETLFRVTWLPIVCQTIQGDWNPHKPTPLINLLDGWRPYIPEMMLGELLQNVVVVKLTVSFAGRCWRCWLCMGASGLCLVFGMALGDAGKIGGVGTICDWLG